MLLILVSQTLQHRPPRVDSFVRFGQLISLSRLSQDTD